MTSRRKRLFDIIQIGSRDDAPSRFFDYFIVAVIAVNIIVLILETFPELEDLAPLFRAVEIVTVVMFMIEYGLRIWTADLLYPGMDRKKAILKFILSFEGIVDLLTILPFFFLSGFSAFRILRVARIFHLFRINAQYDSFHVITSVLMEKRNALLSSLFIILTLMLASSLCMYSAEHPVQPEIFRNAFSGFWWSVNAFFTVGYGDIYPITGLGRFMAAVITFLGVGAVAIPTGIISAGFVEHYTRMEHGFNADALKQNTGSVLVEEGSEEDGKTISEIEAKKRVCVTAVLRGGAVVVPEDRLTIEAGDVVVYISMA
ncbi:MAG: ion transporter [Lachnospiraceae bacterium]|nr:ion transporter [Lachnospiraceae bacterium]